MILIFEGPDGAGKTSMVEAVKTIAEADGKSVSVWHKGPFPADSNAKREYALPLINLTASPDWLVIMDRWHVGEMVYGPLLRGGSRLSDAERGWIEGYLKTLGAVIIYLTATTEELINRVGVRGDDLIKVHQLDGIREAYEVLAADGHTPRLFQRRYDTTGQRTEPTAHGIYAAAKQEVAIAISERDFRTTDHRPYWEKNPWPS